MTSPALSSATWCAAHRISSPSCAPKSLPSLLSGWSAAPMLLLPLSPASNPPTKARRAPSARAWRMSWSPRVAKRSPTKGERAVVGRYASSLPGHACVAVGVSWCDWIVLVLFDVCTVVEHIHAVKSYCCCINSIHHCEFCGTVVYIGQNAQPPSPSPFSPSSASSRHVRAGRSSPCVVCRLCV